MLINKLSYPETINERIYRAIASGTYDCFLPMEMKTKRKDLVLYCNVQDLMSLDTYLNQSVTRKMFLDVVAQVIKMIRKCESCTINANNLDLNIDRMFVDPQTKKLTCIYWPIVNNQNAGPAEPFFKQLRYQCIFDKNEDRSYLDSYESFFKYSQPFSLNNFEKLIKSLMGKQKEPTYIPSSELGKTREKETMVQANNTIEYDPFVNSKPSEPIKSETSNMIFCHQCGEANPGTANYCSRCGMQLKAAQPAPQVQNTVDFSQYNQGTVVLGAENYESGTTLLDSAYRDPIVYSFLIREKTKERITITKAVFHIGTDQNKNDYVIADNTAVSHNHAEILEKDGQYYIRDLHSTNHTFVDGKEVMPDKEVALLPNTKIRLANEFFLFQQEIQ